MALLCERILVHLDTERFRAYDYSNGNVSMIFEESVILDNASFMARNYCVIDGFLERLKKYVAIVDTIHIKIYATGIFATLNFEDRNDLINHVFIYHGLYTVIVNPDLEKFYIESCASTADITDIIEGLVKKEFRKVVVCGSFKHSIREIEVLLDKLHAKGIKILSPTTTKQKPETLGTDFVLFEGQELINERDAWRHQFQHISQFAKADAVIICNPGGRVGNSALFELGYIVALTKRLIFQETPTDLTLYFPYEVGLNF